jgi:hypothetical protein
MAVTIGTDTTIPNPLADGMTQRHVPHESIREAASRTGKKRTWGYHYEWEYTWKCTTAVKNQLKAAWKVLHMGTSKNFKPADEATTYTNATTVGGCDPKQIGPGLWEVAMTIRDLTVRTS